MAGPQNIRKWKKDCSKISVEVLLRPWTHMPIAADRIGNVAINMTSIFSSWSFVVKADLTLAYSFSCSNLRLVCVCVIYNMFLWVGTISSCPWMPQRCLEVHTPFSPSTGWMTVWGYFFLMLTDVEKWQQQHWKDWNWYGDCIFYAWNRKELLHSLAFSGWKSLFSLFSVKTYVTVVYVFPLQYVFLCFVFLSTETVYVPNPMFSEKLFNCP